MTDAPRKTPGPALLPSPGLHLKRTPVGMDMRVTIGGRPGTIVTVWPSTRGVRYGVALDDGAHLPSVGAGAFDVIPDALADDVGD
jgi:hypothetical protein